jgi:preprotein translocase subunit SecD
MSDDLEPRLRNAFRQAPLLSAPASLVDALERVPNARVVRRGRSGRSVWAPLAVAAVLVVAGAAVIVGGQRGIAPSPTAAASLQPSALASTQADGLLRIEYQARPNRDVNPTTADLQAIVAIVEHRLASNHIVGSTVRAEGIDRVIVELPTAIDTNAARTLIGQTGHLDFVPLGTTQMEAGDVVDPTKFPALFSGTEVESAPIGTSIQSGQRVVTFVLKPGSAKLFEDYTAANIGRYFAIVLDGTVISAPVINSAIPGGHVEISSGGIGGYPLKEAQNLVAILQYGSLPFPIVELSSEVVSSSPSPTMP